MNCYYLECGIQRGEDLKNLRGYCVRNQGGTGPVDNTYFECCKNPYREDAPRLEYEDSLSLLRMFEF